MKVFVADDYTGPIKPHTFTDVRFAYTPYPLHNWSVPLGIKNNEVINITNKKLSFLPIEMKSEDADYNKAAEIVYNFIQEQPESADILIEEPMYLFFDFEAATSTVHTIDYLTHTLYFYCQQTPSPTLIIPSTAHPICKQFLDLLERWFPIRYYTIEPNKVYRFKTFTCVRSYIHVHMNEVKEFFTKHLLEPILEKYSSLPAYKTVARIKKAGVNIQNPGNVFSESSEFDTFCKENNILDLEKVESEELRIYYLNKASSVYVTWGSIYYIYTNYYIINIFDKYVSVLFHKEYMAERRFLREIQVGQKNDLGLRCFGQYLYPHCGSFINQIYNTFQFQGEVLEDLTDLREVVEKTQLLNHFKE